MTRIVMIDGELVPHERATVSVFDRGFLYGDSVFETIRTYEGRPFALAEHIERLGQSAARVFIELPVDAQTFAKEVQVATSAGKHPESYIRLMVTRGTGALGLDPKQAELPLRVIIVDALTPPPLRDYEHGIKTITFQTQRFGDSTSAAGAKVGNYLVAVLAMREARASGAAEALVKDHSGRIIEGSTSNVFALANKTLITPPESVGILPGITRARVLEAAKVLGLEVVYDALGEEQLGEIDELFISSSIRELLPVVQVNDRPVADGKPGLWTRRLLRKFRQKVREDMSLEYSSWNPP
jgi:branched-chain amino acid aminotransferase